jgi:glycosyltransferase involved in cell wall biosynthesis
VPGLEDVFTDAKEGLFVDIGDVNGLVTALETLLNNAKLRQQMGHAARERARRFDIATIGLDMRNALESLMAQSKRP